MRKRKGRDGNRKVAETSVEGKVSPSCHVFTVTTQRHHVMWHSHAELVLGEASVTLDLAVRVSLGRVT